MVRCTTNPGNLHLNVVTERYDPEIEAVIEPYIYEWVASVRYVMAC